MARRRRGSAKRCSSRSFTIPERAAADRVVHGLRHAARRRHAGHRLRTFIAVPTKTNPLGVKGGSEAGNVGAPAAIINAIIDALSSFKIADLPMPATPAAYLVRAIHRPND